MTVTQINLGVSHRDLRLRFQRLHRINQQGAVIRKAVDFQQKFVNFFATLLLASGAKISVHGDDLISPGNSRSRLIDNLVNAESTEIIEYFTIEPRGLTQKFYRREAAN